MIVGVIAVEGDDINEPISDAARSLLDGHIVLSRKLASAGDYPAIDVVDSISRLAQDIAPGDQLAAIAKIRELLATHRHHEDMISIGAYQSGTNPSVDAAIAMRDKIRQYVCQGVDEYCSSASARETLLELVRRIP